MSNTVYPGTNFMADLMLIPYCMLIVCECELKQERIVNVPHKLTENNT